jgi:phage terminase large subunit GpA-like protein
MKKAKKLFAKADAKIEAALTKLKRRQSRRLDRPKPVLPKHKKAVHAKATPALPSLAEWIEANIILPNTVAEPGAMHLWPWQRGLAEAIGDPTVERVTLMKATRLGFSSLLTAAIGYFCVVKPSTILYLLPTEADARGFVVDDVEPLFECTPVLQGQLMSPAIALHDRNTMLHRLWPGGSLKVVAGKAPRNLRRHTARVLMIDEADAIEVSGEGDPLALAERRTLTFGDRKIIVGGTPIDASTSHVLRSYNESDKRIFECPCPHCGTLVEILWEHIQWEQDRPETAHFQCPHCKEITEQSGKEAMVRRGQWHITAPHVQGHAGFRLNSLVSLLANCAWPKLAAEFLLVKDNEVRRKVFINTTLGQAWIDEDFGYTDVDLISRVEDFGLDKIPAEVLALVAGADLGEDRTELSIFGVTREGHVLVMSHETVWGSPEDTHTFRELRELLRRRFKHPGGGVLPITLCVIDAGYAQDRVIEFCATQRQHPVTLPGKGASGMTRPAWQMTRTKRNKRLLIVGVDALKSEIYNRLARGRTIRFSNTLTPIYFEQLLSERKVVHYSRGRPEERFERKPGMRAETLDCMVYGFCARAAYTFDFDQREASLYPDGQPVPAAAEVTSDEEGVRKVEDAIAKDPRLLRNEDAIKLLTEMQAAGAVFSFVFPLPLNANPATALAGLQLRDFNNNPIKRDGSLVNVRPKVLEKV